VSVVAGTWERALQRLGFATSRVAGEGPVDHVVAGLAIEATAPPSAASIEAALAGVDLVVVENLLTIPLNLPASRVVADVLRGRPALLHHHDPPWHRARFADVTELPADDPAWRHVAISRLAANELAERGIRTDVVYNAIEIGPPARPDQVAALRARLGADPLRPLLLHPVRAIERKDVPRALRLAAAVDGTYWLPGPAEEGYGPTLDALLARASEEVAVVRVPFADDERAAAYALADAVLYPSTWEGFGIPPLEAAVHRRPVVVGDYAVAAELRELGFRWLPADDPEPLRRALAAPEALAGDLALNDELVRRHFSMDGLQAALAGVLGRAGWLP
jgi:glycosyltransferase involved in cell wall biosynthesis